ncbi:MAG TPA: hypothetical protein VFL55_01590 [Acetobacteraceae bacterium]|jgi:hypothetical protein|nr:hypothetical protein [Acetobacteraceae bacterium]
MPEEAEQRAATVARNEINLLLGLAAQAGVDEATLRQDLRMSDDDWREWLGVLHDAPLPAQPSLPKLLRRLGRLTSRLDRATRMAFA